MSYADMDHAGWVESNISAVRRNGMPKTPKKDKFGKPRGWHTAPEKLNRFQARAMDICGMVFGGIYNAPISWDLVEWAPESLHVPLRHSEFATVDFGGLSRLVFLCHEARIRGRLAVNERGWMLSFWQRSHDGSLSERHPNLLEAMADFEKYLPANHRIRYVAEVDDPLPARRRHHLAWLANSGAERWANDVAGAAEKGDRRKAMSALEMCDREVDTAQRYATELGGGPELAALVAQVEAQRDRAHAVVEAMPAEVAA